MFDNGETPPEGQLVTESSDIMSTITTEPPSPPRRARVAKPKAKPKKVAPPAVEDDITVLDPEERLYYVIELRQHITKMKAEKSADGGRHWGIIQKLERKLSSALNDLALKEVSYSDPTEVALTNNSILGSQLRKKTFFD
jgi:hypothetical protein